MKTQIRKTSKSALSVILTLCMLLSCITVGLIPTSAAMVDDDSSVGGSWITFKRMYFGVPLSWDTSNFTKVYAASKQTDNGGYCYILGDLTEQVSGSRIYGTTTGKNIDHSSWNTEYVFVFATNSTYDVGSGYSSVTSVYSTDDDNIYVTDLNSASNNYFFYTGSDVATGGTLKKRWNKYDNMGYLGTDGTISSGSGDTPYAQQKTVCNTGGSATIAGYRIQNESAATFEAHNTTSGQLGCIVGSKVTITATPTNSDYVFDGFYSDSSYSTPITSGVSGSTYTYSITSKEAKTVYVKFRENETLYSVSVVSEDTDKGTVAAASVSAGEHYAETLPVATPKYGYKFKEWVATAPATIASNATSASAATVNATAANGRVTATFEPDNTMQLYVAGRFHVQTTDTSGVWTNSFDSGDWSDTGDDNIKFTYDSGTRYKLETHASLKNLSDTISSLTPYFFIYDKTDSSNPVYWYAGTQEKKLTPSSKSQTLTKYTTVQSDGINDKLRFDSQSTDKPVTLYFDVATGTVSYDVPDFYDITIDQSISHGGVTSSTVRTTEGTEVTLTPNADTGYQFASWSVKDANNNPITVTNNKFMMPAGNVTVSATFSEVIKKITVADMFGTTIASNISVGINTGAVLPAPSAVPDYTFLSWSVPSSLKITSGSTSTNGSITVKANNVTLTSDLTVTINYSETLYNVAAQVSSSAAGKVTRGGTIINASTQIGNITYVTLKAESNTGYSFTHWEITPDSGKTVTISNGTTSETISAATGDSDPGTGLRKNAELQFKTNGPATVKAHFKATPYSINAQFTHNNLATWHDNTAVITDTNGDALSEGVLNQSFQLRVTLQSGYAIDDNVEGNVEFDTGNGYITPTTEYEKTTTDNGTTKLIIFHYKMPANPGMVLAKITLKAETPVIDEVKIKTNAAGFPYSGNLASGSTVNHYYLQPVAAQTTLDPFFTSTSKVTYSNGSATSAQYNSGEEGTLAQKTLTIPTTEGYTETYTLTVTATNSPVGCTPVTAQRTYTISVSLNDAQKAFVRIKNSLDVLVTEDNSYYYNDDAGNEIAAYNTARSNAKSYTDGVWPAYNESVTTATQYENALRTAYDALMDKAKKTTIYVLSQYAPTDANHPVELHTWKGSFTDADWSHFKMGAYFDSSRVGSNFDTQKMSFEGTYTKSNNNYYLYKYTYKGHCSFIVYRGSSADDTTVSTDKKLTGDVTNVTSFGEYYLNVYNKNVGDTSVTSASPYSAFGHEVDHPRVLLDFEQRIEGEDLINEFGVRASGSLVSAPGIDTKNTSFIIEGPIGKGSTTVELKTDSGYNAFTATKSGKYNVTYTTDYGLDKDNYHITEEVTMSLWVEVDEIKVYVDMNENVGTPVLNFLYYTNSSGTPATAGSASATVKAFLPYEMDLVTGSSSIYEYTVKLSTLKNYKVPFNRDDSININYINVENQYVNTDGKSEQAPTDQQLTDCAFVINPEALITGEYWLKADSSNLNTFNTISYGSHTNTFLAAVEGTGGTVFTNATPVLTSAIGRVYGTGIVSDDDNRVYYSQYAAIYTLEGQTKPVNKLHYVQQTVAQNEVSLKANTYSFDNAGGIYYFDRWVKFATPDRGISVNEETGLTDLSAVTPTEAGGANDLNFTSAYAYNDGNTTYVALYKKAATNDSTVRVEITYKFKDYDTSDGNYIVHYTPTEIANLSGDALTDKLNERTVAASYTKTVKIPVGADETYTDFAAAEAAIQTIVNNSTPYVESRYFDYSYTNNSATVTATKSDESKIEVTAQLNHTPHEYTIMVKNGNQVVTEEIGYYQQTVTLTSDSNVDWKDVNNAVLAQNTNSYTARFVTGSFVDEQDCQIIKQAVATTGGINHTSVVDNSYTEVYHDGSTEKLRHNFYIIDYSGESDFLGGGVIFATREKGAYRQDGVGDVLDTKAHREAFISGILGDNASTEYQAQVIDNIGFRYKPYNNKEDVFRYSSEISAYVTNYTGTNINSSNYKDQTLRVYSFMVYDNNGEIEIVCSEGYGEVSRYIPQS